MWYESGPRLGSAMLFTAAALAGTLALAGNEPEISGIAIATYQSADTSGLSGTAPRDEANAALDIGVSVPAGGGAVELQIKGGTTPRRDGVTSALAEANAAAGVTLDENERGRVVLWQAFYRHDVGNGSLAAGLIDPAAWLDGNDIANNEFTQFLGAGLVNNLTIDFPSASVGAAYTAGLGKGWSLAALLTSATGVEPDYRRAFEPYHHGHGGFAALELQWSGGGIGTNVGVWINSRRHDSDGDGIDDERLGPGAARGIYANVSGGLGRGHWNLRLGWADPRVQADTGFAAVAVAYPVGNSLLGVGATHSLASDHLSGPHRDRSQFEIYLRTPVAKAWTITPDLQYVVHTGFDPAQTGTWVAGVRVGRSF